MKKILSTILCIALLCSVLGSFAFAATVIEEVAITGVSAPAPGEKPSYAATVSTAGCSLDAGNNNPSYYKNGLGWYDLTKEFNVATSTAFAHGHEYRVSVYLSAQEGYAFSKQPKATINGVDAEVELLENGNIIVSYAFPRLPVANPFVDVRESDYFYEAVLWAVENSITAGTTPTTFSPDACCTRAQVVAFLWRAAGCPEPVGSKNPFTDVKDGQYFYKAVLWAVENKITAGITPTTFGPDQGCTRAQVVAFLWRTAGYPEPNTTKNPFSDVKAGEYYEKAVLWAVENGITAGTGGGKFSPDATCTRAQIVAFLHRHSKLAEPLAIVFEPADYQMRSSQEEADFTVQVKGGVAPYSFAWVVCYDNVEDKTPAVSANSPIHVFSRSFSDYDFDAHRSIGVYCVITDAKGAAVESKMAIVHPYVKMSIASQPADYQMQSSQEDASFTVAVKNGVAPYSYEWVICYDNKEVKQPAEKSESKENTFTWSFSDYDFDAYNNIGVYCVITDSNGVVLTSELGNVLPKN